MVDGSNGDDDDVGGSVGLDADDEDVGARVDVGVIVGLYADEVGIMVMGDDDALKGLGLEVGVVTVEDLEEVGVVTVEGLEVSVVVVDLDVGFRVDAFEGPFGAAVTWMGGPVCREGRSVHKYVPMVCGVGGTLVIPRRVGASLTRYRSHAPDPRLAVRMRKDPSRPLKCPGTNRSRPVFCTAGVVVRSAHVGLTARTGPPMDPIRNVNPIPLGCEYQVVCPGPSRRRFFVASKEA